MRNLRFLEELPNLKFLFRQGALEGPQKILREVKIINADILIKQCNSGLSPSNMNSDGTEQVYRRVKDPIVFHPFPIIILAPCVGTPF